MSDFSDRPFMAGSVVGQRSFLVDDLGRLTGVSQRAVFRPGENVAVCVERSRPHQIATVNCGCGFYAYFDGGANPYHRDECVEGLVEGYGVCSVGERGFRAEKARLVALVLPNPTRTHPAWFDRLSDACYPRTWPSLVGIVSGLLGFVGFTLGMVGAIEGPRIAMLSFLITALGVGGFAVMLKADFHGIDRRYPSVRDLSRCHDKNAGRRQRLDLIRRNYPEVPVYGSMRAALAAHPLAPPPAPPVPTPDAEDFWTRSAS